MNLKNVKIESDEDIIFVTVAKYKLFLSRGSDGIDAYALYSHLMFTARLQSTNTIWANDKYNKNGLGWGEARYRKAKKLLLEMGLVEPITRKNEKGQIEKHYLQVKTTTKPQLSNPVCGQPIEREMGNKLFNKQEKSLNKEINACADAPEPNLPEVIDPEKQIRTDLQAYLEKQYLKQSGTEITNWQKEGPCIANIIKRAKINAKTPEQLREHIRVKLKLYESLIDNPINNFEASLTWLPSKILSMWDNLVPKKPIKKSQTKFEASLNPKTLNSFYERQMRLDEENKKRNKK